MIQSEHRDFLLSRILAPDPRTRKEALALRVRTAPAKSGIVDAAEFRADGHIPVSGECTADLSVTAQRHVDSYNKPEKR